MNTSTSPRWSRNSLFAPAEQRLGPGEVIARPSSDRRSRVKTDAPFAQLRFDRFELDEREARLTCEGEPVALAPRPFQVLCALARVPGKLVTKSALRDVVWGHGFVTDAVLKSAISEVRGALQDDPKQPRYIETVWRHGYRFIAPVISHDQSPAAMDAERTERSPHPALAALMTLCRGDAALADLIRAVAATLERDATLTAFLPNADHSLTNSP